MKTAQEMRNITLARRTEIFEELTEKAISLAHGAITRQIEKEAEKGADSVKYQVDAGYAIHLVQEELEAFGYSVKAKGRVLDIHW